MRGAAHGRLRVVLDTNVLISALHFPDGTLSGLWEPLYDERFRLVLSPAIVIELTEKLRGKFGWEEVELQRLLRTLVRKADVVQPTAVADVVPNDADDNEIVACAVVGDADVIVSGDRHLLLLREYQGIPIVRPMDFLRMVGGLR
jgi:putative PIN family toxin of toxin-antitoxin system